jgi:hypothetical protein
LAGDRSKEELGVNQNRQLAIMAIVAIIVGGLAHVSTGAGLGIDVDPEALGEALFVVKP